MRFSVGGDFFLLMKYIDVMCSQIQRYKNIMLISKDEKIENSIVYIGYLILKTIKNKKKVSIFNITDTLKINPSWVGGCEYGKNGPHFEITGTIIRRAILDEFADFITDILQKLYRDLRHTRYRVPVGSVLWLALKSFMHLCHPEMLPIYMNRTNYVAIKMGHAAVKYGRRTPIGANAQAAIAETIKNHSTPIFPYNANLPRECVAIIKIMDGRKKFEEVIDFA